MAINLTKVLTQIQNRISDSATTARDLNKLIAAANRINNSGTQVLTYQSTGQLPSLADSNYIGVIARVASDNVFGDSDGRYYYASGTDSGWRGFKTTQDSADALIEAPASGGGAASATQAQGTAYGFSAGGDQPASSPAARNEIERFSFTSDGNATDYGDLTVVRGSYAAGVMSTTHGYAAGGYGTSNSNVIDKWPFASAANATDVGNLAIARYGMAGQMSETHGYAVGQANVPSGNYIDKWSLSVDGNASDIGDQTSPVRFYVMTASSSTTVNGEGNLTFDGSTLAVTGAITASSTMTVSGNLIADTLDVAGDITLDADGADVILKDGGTEYGRLTQLLGGLTLKSGSSSANAVIFSTDGDAIFAEDAAEAVVKLLDSKITGVVNIGTGKSYSVEKLTNIISNISSKKIISKNKKVSGPYKFVTNIKLLKKNTNWKPKHTLKEGLEKTYKIMKDYY